MDPTAYALHASVEELHWWFVARRKILRSVMRSLPLPLDAHLLEFGSGTGGNLPLLLTFGSVVAVEPNNSARSFSAARHPSVPHFGSLKALTGQRAFDVCLALDVLEHLEEPAQTLRSIRDWLAPNAPLVVTVPAHPWLFGAHDRYLHHHRRYTESLLRAHLQSGGFTVEHITPINCLLFPAAILARALESLHALGSSHPLSSPRGMALPPKWANAILKQIFAWEHHVVPRQRLPIGMSWLAIARVRDVP